MKYLIYPWKKCDFNSYVKLPEGNPKIPLEFRKHKETMGFRGEHLFSNPNSGFWDGFMALGESHIIDIIDNNIYNYK